MSKVSNEALIDVVQVYNDEGRTIDLYLKLTHH